MTEQGHPRSGSARPLPNGESKRHSLALSLGQKWLEARAGNRSSAERKP